MKLKSTALSLSANSDNYAQAKQGEKAPYFMTLVVIRSMNIHFECNPRFITSHTSFM